MQHIVRDVVCALSQVRKQDCWFERPRLVGCYCSSPERQLRSSPRDQVMGTR